MDRRDLALLPDPPVAAASVEPALSGRDAYAATQLEASRQLTLGIVHEMNNALGGIAVLSEIYQAATVSDEGLREGLGLIHKSAGRLQTLVGQLKILNGPAHGERTYLNLTETVRTQFEMFAPLLPKTLRVETTFPAEELAVHLDETALRRVLLNLVLNLRDDLAARPEAAGILSIGIRHRSGSAELILAVDQGFAPAKTAGSAEARARLEDARRVLRAAGGTVIAYSTGACVLELPLVS